MRARKFSGLLVVSLVALGGTGHAQWVELYNDTSPPVDVALQRHDEGGGATTLWAVVVHPEWATTYRRSGTDPWVRQRTVDHGGGWTRVWMPPIEFDRRRPRALVARDSGGAWVRGLSSGVNQDLLNAGGDVFVSAGTTGAYPNYWEWIVTGGADDSGPDGGRVYLWRQVEVDDWELWQTLTAPAGSPGNAFGRSVAVDGSVLAVGAREAVYVFLRDGDTWELDGEVTGPNGEDFGSAVALRITQNAPRLCVGAPLAGPSANGAIHVFEVGSGYPLLQSIEGNVADGALGGALDGVGSFLYAPVGGEAGEVRVYFVGLDGTLSVQRVFDSPALGDSFPECFDAATGSFLTTSKMAGFDSRWFVHEFRSVSAGPEFDYYSFCGHEAPCGNEVPSGGCGNVTGEGARMHLLPDTASGNFFLPSWKVSARSLTPNTIHILVAGTRPKAFPFGDGIRGVGGQCVRFPVTVSDDLGWTLVPLDGAPLPALPVYMQVWYRDPEGPCGSGFNFTNAVEVRR